MSHELEGQHQPLACSDARGEAAPSLAGDSSERGAEYGLRAGTGAGGEDPRDCFDALTLSGQPFGPDGLAKLGSRPENATRFIETRLGTLSYAELPPLLAERVALVELELFETECFAASQLDDELVQENHRRIAGDLVPDWAGCWRDIEVRVGRLEPPAPYQLPMLMRDYALDLQARWEAAVTGSSSDTLEFLAFAEGRFLTMHPFRDFNGRTVRLFLSELLRRLDLPAVELAPEAEEARQSYFRALEAADVFDWQPLCEIWDARLSSTWEAS
jgi:CRISPR-associated endonuclease/helicase Cas3